MKTKSALLLVIFCLLLSIPCYADFDTTDGMIGLSLIFLSIVLVCGTILGFLIKWLLYKLNVAASNWLIFISSAILAGIFLIMISK